MKGPLLVLAALVALPASAWAGDYVWIANRSANSVAIKDTTGLNVVTLSGAPFNFSQPYDIVGIPVSKVVLVSNAGASPGRVSMIHSETLQLIRDIAVPGSLNLRGMSLSADQQSVFVAGQDANGPAVWRVDVASQAATRVGGDTDAGRGAEDCVVIRAGAAGGSGDAPGRVFFSVPGGTPTPYVGVIYFVGSGPSRIQAVPLGVTSPDLMERTPDHSLVFCGCTIGGSETNTRILRIDTATAVATAPVLITTSMNLAHRVYDVTFDPDMSSGVTGWALITRDSSPPELVEIDATGMKKPAVPTQSLAAGLGTIRFMPAATQLYVGDTSGTSQNFARLEVNSSPPPPWTIFGDNVSPDTGPRNFAFMPPVPTPAVTDLSPRGGPLSGGPPLTVTGSGFLPNSLVQLGGTTASFTFVDDATLLVDGSGAGGGLLNLVVTNPNSASGSLDAYYARYNSPGVNPVSGTLPTVSQGYQLASAPQYASAAALRTALQASLGAYNPSIYRVFLWEKGQYLELDQAPADRDLSAQAFWILTRNGGTVTLNEADIAASLPGANRPLALPPGWNLISQPFDLAGGQMNWSDVRVTLVASDFATSVSATTIPGQAMVGSPYAWMGTGYQAVTALQVGEGYFVFNRQSVPVYMIFDNTLVTKPSFAPAPAPGPADPPPPAPPSAALSRDSSKGCGLLGAEALLLLLAVALGRAAGKRG